MKHMRLFALTGLLLTVCSGCDWWSGAGTLNPEALDRPLSRVSDRHDAYISADTRLTDLQRRTYLRDTALLRAVVDEAMKRPPAAQPPGVPDVPPVTTPPAPVPVPVPNPSEPPPVPPIPG